MTNGEKLQEKLYGVSMILAPLLLAASTVAAWMGDGYRKDALSGTFQFYAMVFLIIACWGLTQLLLSKAPIIALGLRVALIFGCASGLGWAYQRIFYTTAQDAGADAVVLEEFIELSNAIIPTLQLPGILLPLSLIITSFMLWRTNTLPMANGILIALAAMSFPLGRISETQVLMYATDLLFIIAFGWIGLRQLTWGTSRQRVSSPQSSQI